MNGIFGSGGKWGWSKNGRVVRGGCEGLQG